ncbi:hypothetical protein ORN12_03040 [Pantoea vagans]|uniref:hypothetical protein n=1 Tax=Pantoea vagans TaxID=470934 RepID=UPI002257B6B5|nr:hypothetical protein [Pantoea vagans]MCX3307987.1 hypothetical protein [Pantoea vagans]
MNKLTAEKCRGLIAHLSRAKKLLGVSMAEESYLEALEIALPILEQQERVEGEGEWIEWGGGKQPVPSSTHVEVKFRNGATNREESAGGWGWECTPDDPRFYDIIAYRIITERATNQNGEQ